MTVSTLATLAVEWGPVAVWVSAFATFLAVLVAALVALSGPWRTARGEHVGPDRLRQMHEALRDLRDITDPWCQVGP